MRSCLFVFLVLASASSAPPDLILPGHKPVRHEVVLDWKDALGAYRFVASPTRGFHGHLLIEPGSPFAFSSKYGTRIWALPVGAALPDAAGVAIARDSTWPNARVPVGEIRSVALGHPLARVVTSLRIVEVRDGVLRFERVGERRYDAHGRELGSLDWLPLLVIALGGAAWLMVLDRRRPRVDV